MKIGIASADWSSSVFDANGHPVWGGSGWARCGQYVDLLPHDVVVGTLVGHAKKPMLGVREYLPDHDEEGEWKEWNWLGQDHFDCDVLIVQRIMYEGAADNIARAVAGGQVVISDVDDWYWGLSTQNAAFLSTHPKINPKDNLHNYKSTIARSSYVMASTPYLADRLKAFTRCPIEVLPNTVDFNRFNFREQATTPTVGWAGSTSHRSGDLEVLRGVGSALVREGVPLVHAGHVEWARSFAEAVGVPDEHVRTLPLVAPERYPEILQFDIGLVPLADVPFNLSKSTIKSLEMTAAGIPFIASNVGEYARQKATTGAGRMVRKYKDWMRHIRDLEDVSGRVEEAEFNRKALDCFSIENGVARLDEFLRST